MAGNDGNDSKNSGCMADNARILAHFRIPALT